MLTNLLFNIHRNCSDITAWLKFFAAPRACLNIPDKKGRNKVFLTLDQNGAKMHGNIGILLEHSNGKIGSFDGLTVLIVQFDEMGEVNLK